MFRVTWTYISLLVLSIQGMTAVHSVTASHARETIPTQAEKDVSTEANPFFLDYPSKHGDQKWTKQRLTLTSETEPKSINERSTTSYDHSTLTSVKSSVISSTAPKAKSQNMGLNTGTTNVHEKNSDLKADHWVELWKNVLKIKHIPRQPSATFNNLNASSTVSTTRLIPGSTNGHGRHHHLKAERWVELWKNNVMNARHEPRPQDSVFQDSRSTSTIAPIPTKDELERYHPEKTVDKWLKLWKLAVKDKFTKNSFDLLKIDSVHQNSEDSELLKNSQEQKIDDGRRGKAIGTHLKNHLNFKVTDAYLGNSDSKLVSENMVTVNPELMDNSETADSNTKAKPLNEKFLRQSETLPKDQGENTKEFKSKVSSNEDSFWSGTATITFIVAVTGSCLGLVVLLIVFLVCIYCKKQTKGMSNKNKKLTTLNSDVNRIDLQILRPSKESIDSFTFGLPISSVEETLKTVVVEPREVKY